MATTVSKKSGAVHYRIECFFNRLTHCRAVATRYAKRARNFASLIYRAATMLCKMNVNRT